jgi:ribose-phosphate pyrophosphokinase
MITANGFEVMDFPAGESFVKMGDCPEQVVINWSYENDSEIMKLALMVNVLGARYIVLNMPYIPHARQDRATARGLPFSLEVFVKMLSNILSTPSSNYRYNNIANHVINVVDPHSEVFEQLCEKHNLHVKVKRQWEFAKDFMYRYDYVIAPDKGAVQKAAKWAAELGIPMIPCSKVRDPATGTLYDPSVPNVDFKGKKLLVVDDICDGGYTFIQLSNVIRERCPQGMNGLDLFITHGIFSKGLGQLALCYDDIYTTNSLLHHKIYGNLLNVLEI